MKQEQEYDLLKKSIQNDSSNNLVLKVKEIFETCNYDTELSITFFNIRKGQQGEIDLLATKSCDSLDGQRNRKKEVLYKVFVECKYIPNDQVWLFWEDDNCRQEEVKNILAQEYRYTDEFLRLMNEDSFVYFAYQTHEFVRLHEQRKYSTKYSDWSLISDYDKKSGMAKSIEQVLDAHNSLRPPSQEVIVPIVVVGGSSKLTIIKQKEDGIDFQLKEVNHVIWNFRYVGITGSIVDYPVLVVHVNELKTILEQNIFDGTGDITLRLLMSNLQSTRYSS